MLCDILRRLIRDAGKSQKDIACELGMSQQRFNYYVTGKREPDHSMLKILSDYFDVSVDYLLGSSAKKEKPTPVYESGPTDDELAKMWMSLSPAEVLRVKDFALEMIANRKEPPARSD